VTAKTITSDRLKGLEVDHTDCRFSAPAFSTGVLLHESTTIGEEEPKGWLMEFQCTVCQQSYFSYRAAFHDRIREALIENGILPPSHKVGPSY
jgi:hypothetical protein